MSHTKRSFVQSVVARICPKPDDRDRALRFAEELWNWLGSKGYGAPEQRGPRESVDWYGRLTGVNKGWFDRFWRAYGHKQDRNGAAMRWHQLGDLTTEQAERIIDAAASANRHWRDTAPPGQIRKLAQGWLFERRWDDHTEPEAPARATKSAGDEELLGLKHKLAALKRLQTLNPNDETQQQIEELVKRIGNFRRPKP